MSRRARRLTLIGETIREAGLLIVVFGPLDWLFADQPMGATVPILLAVFGLLVVACGILVESRE